MAHSLGDNKFKELAALVPLYILKKARLDFGSEYGVSKDFFLGEADMDKLCRKLALSWKDTDRKAFKAAAVPMWRAALRYLQVLKLESYISYFLWQPDDPTDDLEPLMLHLEHSVRAKAAEAFQDSSLARPLSPALPILDPISEAAQREFDRVFRRIRCSVFVNHIFSFYD
ncbi:unnamed protein product [Sphagnum tenellum]